MQEITTLQGTGLQTSGNLNSELFNAFIEWIDRSENTARAYIINLRQFAAWLKYSNVTAPERKDIITYREWLATEHEAIRFDPVTGWAYRTDRSGNRYTVYCKPATVRQYLQAVKRFFAWTAAGGHYPNIAENVHAPRVEETHKKDSLTASEVLAVEQSITRHAQDRAEAAATSQKDTAGRTQRSTEQGKRLYAMYLLAVNAGLRTVEISRANIKDLETKNGSTWLYVWGKGHHEADTKKPIAQEVMDAIQDYLQSRTDAPNGNSPLFVSTGNRSKGKRIAPTTISKMLKAALQEAGYNSDRLTAHSLRHTAGQAIMDITDQNIYKAQMYMRHASPKTTEIYLQNDSTKQDEILAERLYRHYHGADQQDSLQTIIATLTPRQREQLAQFAGAFQS